MQNNHHSLYFRIIQPVEIQSTDISTRSHPIRPRWPSTTRTTRIVSDAVERLLDTGASVFRRDIMLPRLIPVGPDELADQSDAGRSRVLQRLAKALRGERTRGRAGHWTYSLNRHIGLLQAFRAERAALRKRTAVTAAIDLSAATQSAR